MRHSVLEASYNKFMLQTQSIIIYQSTTMILTAIRYLLVDTSFYFLIELNKAQAELMKRHNLCLIAMIDLPETLRNGRPLGMNNITK